MTIVLTWRRPAAVVTTVFRGLDDDTAAAIAETGDPTPIAAIIGPRGPAGVSAGADVTRAAGAAIGALKAVRIDAADLAQLADKNAGSQAIGVTTNAAAPGGALVIRTAGLIEDDSWNWAEGPVWLGTAGALTQSVPTSGRLVRIGRAAGPNGLIVEVELVANLN